MPGRAVRSTRQTWIEAAYVAVGQGGVDAIAVEPIAAALGVTKGGFYYRFSAREELITATLEHWTAQARALMARCTDIPDPSERLRTFLLTAIVDDQLRGADSWLFLHSSTHPLVRPVAQGAAAENVEWFTVVLIEAGVDATEARGRAHLCWSAYLGIVAELASSGAPDPAADAFAEVDLLVRLVTGRRTSGKVK